MASYGKKSYWNERYARETEPCDWIVNDYSIFQHLLSPQILNHVASPPGGEIRIRHLNSLIGNQCNTTFNNDLKEMDWRLKEPQDFPPMDLCRILHVGCGNSQLGECMLLSGFADIVNVDSSDVVIKKMQEKYNDKFFANLCSCTQRNKLHHDSPKLDSRDDGNSSFIASRLQSIPKMTFHVGDITKGLDYPDESFDLIICKKTLDVILCGVGSVANAKSMMTECFRLLNKEHGIMMIISSAKPDDRAYYFEQDPWSGIENIKLSSISFEQRNSHERFVDSVFSPMVYFDDDSHHYFASIWPVQEEN